VTLSASEAYYAVYAFTGTLTANISVKLPYQKSSRFIIVHNNTSGAFTLTMKTTFSGSTGVSVVQGTRMLLYHDGINVYAASGNGVTSFNTRTGAVTLTSSDVTTALGFTPRDAAATTVNTFNGRSGTVTPASSDYSFSQISGSVTDAQVPDTITASNYLPLTGGTTSGNVGIGIAPSAWSSSYYALRVGYGYLMSYNAVSNASTTTQMGLNSYFNGSDWKYVGTDEATNYYQFDGTHGWRGAVSGTAGNNITWINYAALSSGGFDLTSGSYKVNGTSVIDSSRNANVVNMVSAGSQTVHTRSVSTIATLDGSDYAIFAVGASGYTINLPALSGTSGRVYVLLNLTSPNSVITVDPSGSETIGGASTFSLAGGGSLTIISTGSTWVILSTYVNLGS
jgi:hypothetical protein